MKDKLTHSLPQIRCTEETRKAFDEIALREDRTISKILQMYTEVIAKQYNEKVNIPTDFTRL